MAAPKTNLGKKSEKHWRQAIMIAVNRDHEGDPEGRKKLQVMADKLAELAIAGDVSAAKEIGDRLDGRSTQPLAGDPDNPLQLAITKIERVIVDSITDQNSTGL